MSFLRYLTELSQIILGRIMLECVRQGREGVFVDVHVVPSSKKESVDYDVFGKRLRLKVLSPAVDGKANGDVLSFFSAVFGDCVIVSGLSSRKKTVLLRNLGLQGVLTGLEGLVRNR
jgi:hypothetical protein